MEKIKSRFLMALVFTLLSGCVPPDVPTPSPLLTTATITWIPTRTPTYLPTITFTPIPTLYPEEAYRLINELLSNNDNCRLPCCMGITPGLSTWQKANELLMKFSGIARWLFIGATPDEGSFGDLTILNPDDNMVIEVSPSYMTSPDGELVSVIGIHTRTYKMNNGEYDGDVYGYQPYFEMMRSYTLAEVISTYGPASQIYVSASLYGIISLSPHITDYFLLHLWYPEQGVFLKYKMPIDGIGENYRMCPSDSFISGYLIPPGLDDEYIEETLLGFGDEYSEFFPPTEFIKSIEEAYEITTEEFYQVMSSLPDTCLETKKSIWWP